VCRAYTHRNSDLKKIGFRPVARHQIQWAGVQRIKIHTRTNTHTYTHAHAHTQIHTHTHKTHTHANTPPAETAQALSPKPYTLNPQPGHTYDRESIRWKYCGSGVTYSNLKEKNSNPIPQPGYTYDRENIQAWWKYCGSCVSPLSSPPGAKMNQALIKTKVFFSAFIFRFSFVSCSFCKTKMIRPHTKPRCWLFLTAFFLFSSRSNE
jgi:hypothetical protein